MKNMEKIILELTPPEKTLILLMYFSPAHSMSMSLQEGITGALLQKNIISLASSVGDNVGVFTFPCVLQPWVVRYLSSHPEILNTMSEKQIQNLINDHYRRLSQIF
jgi:hypothetical protein